MNPQEVKVRQKVVDRWYSSPSAASTEYWGSGIIKKVLKTRIHVKFENLEDVVVYDLAHFRQFVEKGNYFKNKKQGSL